MTLETVILAGAIVSVAAIVLTALFAVVRAAIRNEREIHRLAQRHKQWEQDRQDAEAWRRDKIMEQYGKEKQFDPRHYPVTVHPDQVKRYTLEMEEMAETEEQVISDALKAIRNEQERRRMLEQAHAREVKSVCLTCGSRTIDGRCTLCR